MKKALLTILTLTLAILFANLSTDKVRKMQESSEFTYEMIQLIEDRPAFSVTNEDLTPVEGAFSAIVSLHTKVDKNNPDGFVCSGVVISNEYVLTAAHCLVDQNGSMSKSIKIKSLGTLPSVQDGIPVGINQRADYALIKGDFSLYNKLPVDTTPQMFFVVLELQSPIVACGFPWGDSPVCYPVMGLNPCGSQFCGPSILYPGMSGGPVIDVRRGVVIAVNTAVGDGYIVISPLIGIFKTLGVEVK